MKGYLCSVLLGFSGLQREGKLGSDDVKICYVLFVIFWPGGMVLSNKIIHFIRLNSDTGKISFLVLLGLSVEFDTGDHNILLQRLENWVWLSGMVQKWFRSYFQGFIHHILNYTEYNQ